MNEGKFAISGQFPRLIPVPNRGGTGTTHQNRVGIGTGPSGTGTLLPTTLISCILTLLSPNSYTDGIRTLIND